MGKRSGKSTKKNRHRQQGRTQQGGEQLRPQQEQLQMQHELQTQGAGRTMDTTLVNAEAVREIRGMSDEWRVFYSAVSQAVKKG